jgi:hypothetical protein
MGADTSRSGIRVSEDLETKKHERLYWWVLYLRKNSEFHTFWPHTTETFYLVYPHHTHVLFPCMHIFILIEHLPLCMQHTMGFPFCCIQFYSTWSLEQVEKSEWLTVWPLTSGCLNSSLAYLFIYLFIFASNMLDHLSHSPGLLLIFYFWDRVKLTFPGGLELMILLPLPPE